MLSLKVVLIILGVIISLGVWALCAASSMNDSRGDDDEYEEDEYK